MDVRRLAAIDMWGTRGTSRRRRIIVAEFIIGVVAMVAFGSWLVTAASGAGFVIGLYMISVGLNYLPLAAYAIILSRAGVLDSELAGVDTMAELRRYSVLQFWVFVPMVLVFFTLTHRRQSLS